MSIENFFGVAVIEDATATVKLFADYKEATDHADTLAGKDVVISDKKNTLPDFLEFIINTSEVHEIVITDIGELAESL